MTHKHDYRPVTYEYKIYKVLRCKCGNAFKVVQKKVKKDTST
jgi:hypothetical protein